MNVFLIGIALITIAILGLFLLSGGQLIALDYSDFPRDELEKLIVPNLSEAELSISGSLEVQLSSSLTWWAMKLSPGTFFLDVRINGYKASLILDTGAALSFLSPHIAVTAKVPLTSSRFTVQHGWREVPVYMGRVQELELGNIKIQNLPVIVGGNQPVIKLLGLPVWNLDGILGMEPLQRLVLTLDYEGGIVALRQESSPLQASSTSLRILRESGLGGLEHPKPIVDCFLSNFGPFPCFIDTGTSAPIFVPREIWQTLGLEGQKHSRVEVKLGELELKEVPAVRANVPYITIGSNIFQSQGIKHLTLDFLAGKLYAER